MTAIKKHDSPRTKRWADRFLNEPWKDVTRDWNKQDALSSIETRREESSFNRALLSQALTEWSLGMQKNLLPRLAKNTVPILWIVGENDKKFRKIAEAAATSTPKVALRIIPRAHHRVMWEKPSDVLACIDEFIAR